MKYPLFYVNPYKQDIAELSCIKACFVLKAPAGSRPFDTFAGHAMRDFGFMASFPLRALVASRACLIPKVTSPAVELSSTIRNNFNSMKVNFFSVLINLLNHKTLYDTLRFRVAKFYRLVMKECGLDWSSVSDYNLKHPAATVVRNLFYTIFLSLLYPSAPSKNGKRAVGFDVTSFFNFWEPSGLLNAFIRRSKKEQKTNSTLLSAAEAAIAERRNRARNGNILLNSDPRLFL